MPPKPAHTPHQMGKEKRREDDACPLQKCTTKLRQRANRNGLFHQCEFSGSEQSDGIALDRSSFRPQLVQTTVCRHFRTFHPEPCNRPGVREMALVDAQ